MDSAILAGDLPVFVASGASHAPGAVPDPGSVAGTSRFLREDATFAVVNGTLSTRGRSTLGGNISITANTVTNLLSVSITAPSAGGNFRALVSYGMFISFGVGTCQLWVDDSQGGSNVSTPSNVVNDAVAGGTTEFAGASDITPNSYANSTALTFTLKTSCGIGATAVTTGGGGTGSQGTPYLTVVLAAGI